MSEHTTEARTEAIVVKIINEFTVVVNKGAKDGVKLGHRYLIYGLGDELCDPDTGESLGRLEIVRGTGKVIHVQDRMATIRSDRVESRSDSRRRIIKRPLSSFGIFLGGEEVVEEIGGAEEIPFVHPTVGDRARPI